MTNCSIKILSFEALCGCTSNCATIKSKYEVKAGAIAAVVVFGRLVAYFAELG